MNRLCLYTRAFQLISHELNAPKIISDATNELAMGEVMQLMNINNIDLSESDYYRVIHLKTAVLFSAACQFSAVLAQRDDIRQCCADYGRHLGIAFQIADDVLDYIGHIEKTGKNVGDDLTEHKMTLPLIHALQHAKDSDKTRLRHIIEQGNRDTIDEVIAILKRTDSIAYTVQAAYQQADSAKAALTELPESRYKTLLLQLADMAVKRNQ